MDISTDIDIHGKPDPRALLVLIKLLLHTTILNLLDMKLNSLTTTNKDVSL